MTSQRPFDRRTLLQSGIAGGAAALLAPTSLRAAGAAERINLGIIGCGWRGGQLLELFSPLPGVRIAGLCDPDQELAETLGEQAPDAAVWTDLRQMLDAPHIDAVAIATCNHWHCLAAIWAMQAGKHVYVEKPLGHTQWEGEQVVLAADRYGRICQVGTQQRSDPMQAEIKQLLHEDQRLGEVEAVRVNRFGVREPIGKRETPLTPPESVDYNLWLGPAHDEPIYRDKLHYDWHWVWNTGSGEMGNWGVHILDDVRNNVFRDSVAAPSAITAAGARLGYQDAGNTPNLHFALLDAGGLPVVVALSNLPVDRRDERFPGPASGYVVYCSEGRLEGQRRRAVAYDADGEKIAEFSGNGGNPRHQQNFLDAIREEKPELLMAPVQIGHDSTTWCNLINIATRSSAGDNNGLDRLTTPIADRSALAYFDEMQQIAASAGSDEQEHRFEIGPTLRYDLGQRQFVGAEADSVNRLLRREDRQPFVVPDLAKG